MPAVVPSFVAKVARAKKHLIELDEAIKRFAATHPYTVRESVEGKKKRKVRRIMFTADPGNTDIPLIAADVIYNLRSSLDHLMSALVAKTDRRSAIFPIYFEGVWEAGVPGENQERAKQRSRWVSDTKTLSDDAVAVLKRLQPPDTGGQDPEPPILRLLNSLSNRDRHEKLPVITPGVENVRFQAVDSRGVSHGGRGQQLSPRHVLENQAEILDLPKDTVKVEVEGTPLVGIQMGAKDSKRYVRLPSGLKETAAFVESAVFPPLVPYVRTD